MEIDGLSHLALTACRLRHKAHWVFPHSAAPCHWCGISGNLLTALKEPTVFHWPLNSDPNYVLFENIPIKIKGRCETFETFEHPKHLEAIPNDSALKM